MGLTKQCRVVFRLCCVGLFFSLALIDFFFRIWLTGRSGSHAKCARWMNFWAQPFLWIFGLTVQYDGTPPTRGILCPNHLSYLDIVTLGSIMPLSFVSKSEVASWPVIGIVTRCGGALYLVRQKKSDVVRVGEEMAKVVETGLPLTLFLEGTSSDGAKVLPFRSSLLAPVEEYRWPVTPAWIQYSLPAGDGSAGEDVCYWGDTTFGQHLPKLLSKKRIHAVVRFGQPLNGESGRKELAKELHAQVCRLQDEYRGKKETVMPPTPAQQPV